MVDDAQNACPHMDVLWSLSDLSLDISYFIGCMKHSWSNALVNSLYAGKG
jgi:hypothetical protein